MEVTEEGRDQESSRQCFVSASEDWRPNSLVRRKGTLQNRENTAWEKHKTRSFPLKAKAIPNLGVQIIRVRVQITRVRPWVGVAGFHILFFDQVASRVVFHAVHFPCPKYPLSPCC